ncbi:MAG TPA: hypothetical protein VLF40_05995 [Candidatus Saccharimonadales bacterium]|nr:hypothetical protein [Candidatus Saccharimonadales bacterium]
MPPKRKPQPGQEGLFPEEQPKPRPAAPRLRPNQLKGQGDQSIQNRRRLKGGLEGLYKQGSDMQRRTRAMLERAKALGAPPDGDADVEPPEEGGEQRPLAEPNRPVVPRPRQPNEDDDPAADWRNVPWPNRFPDDVQEQHLRVGLAQAKAALAGHQSDEDGQPEDRHDEA